MRVSVRLALGALCLSVTIAGVAWADGSQPSPVADPDPDSDPVADPYADPAADPDPDSDLTADPDPDPAADPGRAGPSAR